MLQTALYALYSHYEEEYDDWQRAGIMVPLGMRKASTRMRSAFGQDISNLTFRSFVQGV